VRNLQTKLPIATDAWGRAGKLQPVLISCSVYLREVFGEASEKDEVTGGSTVHYGSLSNAILEAVAVFYGGSLRHIVERIRDSLVAEEDRNVEGLLTSKILNVLTITITLPKASLLGSGLSFTQSTTYDASSPKFTGVSYALKLQDLHIPTLIGVNANERLAKQMVVANVEVDRWVKEEDCYVELERIIVSVRLHSYPSLTFLWEAVYLMSSCFVLSGMNLLIPDQTISESSFQTLESLTSHLSHIIVKEFILPNHSSLGENFPLLNIALEKPTAVTMADAPCVELRVDTNPNKSKEMGELWKIIED
jgi:dihydroneopterin aldolase